MSTSTPTTEIYTLSLHDALPILRRDVQPQRDLARREALRDELRDGPLARGQLVGVGDQRRELGGRSEEHTSELQSLRHLVCRLLLEKKKKKIRFIYNRGKQ